MNGMCTSMNFTKREIHRTRCPQAEVAALILNGLKAGRAGCREKAQLAGMASTVPARMPSPFMLLADFSALTLTPYWWAMLDRVSPRLTL